MFEDIWQNVFWTSIDYELWLTFVLICQVPASSSSSSAVSESSLSKHEADVGKHEFLHSACEMAIFLHFAQV